MSEKKTWSAATLGLRELNGDGPVEIQLRVDDFNIVSMQGPKGEVQSVPARTLVAFSAARFRELMDGGKPTGHWEFRVPQQAPGGGHQTHLVYVSGQDILTVKGVSKVI